MPTDVTLSPLDYKVLQKVPAEWWDERDAALEIGIVLARTTPDVLRRISRLVVMDLVQRRHTERGPIRSDIRRISKLNTTSARRRTRWRISARKPKTPASGRW